MAAPTALQLVNRVNRKRRQVPDTTIVSQQSLATLDAINKAMNDVLSAMSWEFDMRRASLVTKARNIGGTYTYVSGTTAVQVGSFDTSTLVADLAYGDFILRWLPVGDANFGDTAFRVLRASTPNLGGSVFVIPDLPDSLSSGVECQIFYAEYMLPETVKTVHRVSYQEGDLSLEQIGPTIEFDEAIPRPHIEYGEPRSVSVGGWDISTYDATFGANAPDPRLRMIVWPVPDQEYVLDYQYDYRHPELTSDDDTLDGVSTEVVDSIVEFATADMIAHWEKRVEEARALRRDAAQILENIHERHGGQTSARATIHGWESLGGGDYYRFPRNRLIGGA